MLGGSFRIYEARRSHGIPASRVCHGANQNQSRSFTWMARWNKERPNFYLPIKKEKKKKEVEERSLVEWHSLPTETLRRLDFTENWSFKLHY